MQHYKKMGPSWIWACVSMTFFFSFWVDFLYNHSPDTEWFRKPRPPPLDYPNALATPDSTQLKEKETLKFKYAIDSGLYKNPRYKVVDGKKVFDRFAGVNQPMERI